MSWKAQLNKLGACKPAMDYAGKFQDTPEGFAEAWGNLEDGEKKPHSSWMTWLAMRTVDCYGVIPTKLKVEVEPKIFVEYKACDLWRLICPAEKVYAKLMEVV